MLPDLFKLGGLGVDLFFVISGFVMVTITRGRFSRDGEILRFIWGRLTRIYPTYWFYFFLTVLVFLIKPMWVNASQAHQVNYLSSFLLFPSNRLPLVMVAWTLIHELWFYLVFSFFLKFKEHFLLRGLLLWLFIVTIANIAFDLTNLSVVAKLALHPYSVEFIIGSLLAIGLHQFSYKISAPIILLTTMFALLIGFSFVYASGIYEQTNLLRSVVVGLLWGQLVFCLACLEIWNKFYPPKFLQFVGNVSYTVYLSHVLVLSAIGRLWSMTYLSENSLFDNAIACLVMLGVVLMYGWVGYRFIERQALEISHRLRVRWFDKANFDFGIKRL